MMLARIACSILGSLMLVSTLFLPALTHAAEPKWAAAPYKYIVIDQDIRDVLIEFGRNANVPTQIAPTVTSRRIRGSVGILQEGTAQAFLQRFCDSYGLVWYFDGTVLHVASLEDIQTESIKLERAKSTDILNRLGDLGLSDSRFTLRVADIGGTLSVSGPPAFRARVRKTVMSAEAAGRLRPARETEIRDAIDVRVFRGGS